MDLSIRFQKQVPLSGDHGKTGSFQNAISLVSECVIVLAFLLSAEWRCLETPHDICATFLPQAVGEQGC